MSRAEAWIAGPLAPVRWGLKGPRAAQVIAEAGIAVPGRANTGLPLDPGAGSPNVIARLGNSEFFIEAHDGDPRLAVLEAQLTRGVAGAYPVLREDAAFVLGGAAADDALAQVCNVDFATLDLAACPIVMTSMIGVGVLVMPQPANDGVLYRIWCDPTFGPYLESGLGAVIGDSKRKTG
jgi:sarcosine oxidase, subunit gamma